ncbi:metal ABC transporter ATP-binding protein [Erysipelothrix urinaevulpis]|uniref:metal ABC transporter ATP-binding protein n=1 Tax=Erysipelothrix urinaevulpis TaxID=2683717 RepID=UPI00135C591A|nr:metal ABC transporter ATP-binding protein [Erysipelothrix urinaevulpis]
MIKVENLHVSYYGNEVVKDVSFEFNTGSLIGIIGPNGAGKSTMIKAILGLIPKDKGTITVDQQSIDEARKKIAYVPQRNDLDWDFPINVFDTVLMGTYPKLGLIKRPKEREKELAKESLKRVGMLDYANQQIGELSGGQQQRVFLARALAQEADLFFLDEPFVGIDVASEKKIVDILKELKDEGKTVFVVHHDLSKVESYFDELILINKELVKAGKVKDVFIYETMNKAYESSFAFPRIEGARA